MSYKILVVDDEVDIVELIKDYFEMNNYEVLIAYNGKQALTLIEKSPDLILLDINLPDIDGLNLCKKIRNYVSAPILFLTAKVEEKDKIIGFGVGGDDYIVKPFSLDELKARVSAHLRRQEREITSSKKKFIDNLVIDYGLKCVFFNNKKLPFVKKEFEIIEFLSLNNNQVFDKERIYDCVWGYDGEGDSSVVAEHIRRIRVKLAKVSDKKYIDTVWGIGYRWIG